MTTDLVEALADLEEAISGTIPASPVSVKSKRDEKKLTAIMVDYFKKLERAFPYSKLEAIYKRYVKESAGSDANNMIDPILAAFRARILADLTGQHASVYLRAVAEVMTWGKTKGGIPIAYEGPPIKAATDYASSHGAKLVKGLDEETRRRLADTVSRGIKNKRGVDGLTRDIRAQFADMTKYRSQLIAKSETRDALFHGSQDTMEHLGVTGKEWVLGAGGAEGNCADCIANAAVGPIPAKQEFPTSQYDIHPGCTCAIAPVMLPKAKK